ncbi:hypothetical protein C5E45_23910 [Nocardia nova]|uniref:Uncharacterized protein n=2 Tax=Nocardia nova TaxID=37330 RepID=A0A2S6AKV9_9NOCA|nr:hypothetical protein C5E45_23910 [Nocardia nova]
MSYPPNDIHAETSREDGTADLDHLGRIALLAKVQDLAAEHNRLADAVGASLPPDSQPDPETAAAIDAAMPLVGEAAVSLRNARREAEQAGIPARDVETAYAIGCQGVRSTDTLTTLQNLAAERDRVVFENAGIAADNDHLRRAAEAERSQRTATSEEAAALKQQLAAAHALNGTDLGAIFRGWQAETESPVTQHFRAPVLEQGTGVDAVSPPGGDLTVYTAEIQVTQPGADEPVRLRPEVELPTEARAADWVRTQLSTLGCALDAHVCVTAEAAGRDGTVPVLTAAGYPHVVDENVEQWRIRVAAPARGFDPALAPDTPQARPASDPTFTPSAGDLLSASFDEAEPSPGWVNDNGVVTALADHARGAGAEVDGAGPG